MDEGPRFFLDFGYTTPATAAVYIRGAFQIPALLTSGSVRVDLGQDGCTFNAESKILGFVESKYTLSWAWDLSSMLAAGNLTVGSTDGIASKICDNLMILIGDAVNLAIEAGNYVLDKIDEAVNWIGNKLDEADKLCDSMKGGFLGDWDAAACQSALDNLKSVIDAGMKAAKDGIRAVYDTIVAMVRQVISLVIKIDQDEVQSAQIVAQRDADQFEEKLVVTRREEEEKLAKEAYGVLTRAQACEIKDTPWDQAKW